MIKDTFFEKNAASFSGVTFKLESDVIKKISALKSLYAKRGDRYSLRKIVTEAVNKAYNTEIEVKQDKNETTLF